MILQADLLRALSPEQVFVEAFGFPAHPWQQEYLATTTAILLLKGRQVGASLAGAAKGIHRCVYYDNSLVVVISPTQKQSQELTKRAKLGLARLDIPLVQDSAAALSLRNGSRLLSLSGSAKSARGYSADLLIVDEAAYVEEATWLAARALVATGGQIVIQSTGALPFGAFFELCTANDPDYTTITVRSDQVSTISPEFLAQQRRILSPAQYSLEFEAVFGLGNLGYFDAAQIAAATVEVEIPMLERIRKVTPA